MLSDKLNYQQVKFNMRNPRITNYPPLCK